MAVIGAIVSWHEWILDLGKALWKLIKGGAVIGLFCGLAAYIAQQQETAWALLIALPSLWGFHKFGKGLKFFTPKYTNAPGKSRWGKMKDLKEAGLLQGDGIYCGETSDGLPVSYPGDRHIITLGGTRRGKDTGLLVPNLRRLRRSIVVIDPKGELAAITANFRSRIICPVTGKRAKVIIVDPFNLLGRGSHGFNPFATMSVDQHSFFANMMGWGEAMVKLEGNNPHWQRRSRALISSIGMRVKWLEKEREKFTGSIGHVMTMLNAPHIDDKSQLNFRSMINEISAHHYEPMAGLARGFQEDDDKHNQEIRDVIATARGQLSFLSDPVLIADMDKHPKIDGRPFDFEMLKHQLITVYIILPDDMLTTHAVWLRVVISNALNAMKRTAPGRIRPLLMLNEIGNLGHLEPLETGMGMAAGKGMTIWTLFQSLSQMDAAYSTYGRETFISGAGVFNALGADDLQTAEYLSKRIGSRTEVVRNYNVSPETLNASGTQQNPMGFPLLRPEDILRLGSRKLISWFEHSDPYMLKAPGYWTLKGMTGLDPNPYYKP